MICSEPMSCSVSWSSEFLALSEKMNRILTRASSCATAFSNPQGAMLLKTSMSLSETLARLTMMLNRRPDLLRRVKREAGDDSQKSLAEKSAEAIQKIFRTCLLDRTTDRWSRPEGTKVAVYMFANLVLKLLFAVSWLRSP